MLLVLFFLLVAQANEEIKETSKEIGFLNGKRITGGISKRLESLPLPREEEKLRKGMKEKTAEKEIDLHRL